MAISTWSPTRKKGVVALPLAINSRARSSARQDTPRAGSAVRDRAAAQDRACGQRTCLRDVREQVEERKVHLTRVGITDQLTIEPRLQLQMQASLAKRVTQLVRRHGERRERGRWLGYEKTEAFGELGRDQIAEGPIIGQA